MCEYIRTAGLPSGTYGYDIHGCSDSALADTTRAVVAAAMPPTAGKNPVLVLNAANAIDAEIDPAYAAHVLPIRTWALAIWDRWVESDQLSIAFNSATAKLSKATSTAWNKVAGPAAATVASAARISWTFSDPWTAVDDLGQQWNFAHDSPAAIGDAVKASVSRWRTDQLISEMPAANPHQLDLEPDGDGIAVEAKARRGGFRGSRARPILLNTAKALASLY